MPISSKTREQLQTGIYCWCNITNGKMYVGSTTTSFESRKYKHLFLLRKGIHDNRHLQSSWSKYGEDCFGWIVLWRCLPKECIEWEQWWIDRLRVTDQRYGYNLSPTAGSTLGVVRSAEARKNHSVGAKRARTNPEVKARYDRARDTVGYKVKRPEAQRLTLSTPEARARMAAAARECGNRPEVSSKKSATLRKLWSDPEYRDKHLAALNEARRKRSIK